jgi:HK97 family phage major capsid protein
MFTLKTIAEQEAMTNEELQAYKTAEKAHEKSQILEEAKAEAKKEVDAQKARIDELEGQLTDLSASKSDNKVSLVEEVKENKEKLKSLASGQKGEIELKALTTRASVDPNLNYNALSDIGQLGVKRRSLYNVLPKVQVSNGNHNGVIKYRDWDEATVVRAAASVAEGVAFPESTAKFKDYLLPIQKIGDTLPVTEEFFEDEVQAASELSLFLDTNVNTVIDSQIINGDGTGTNLKGLLSSTPAYTAVASGIDAPNLKDLTRKMRTAIVKNRGSKYSPDVVVANSDVIDTYILAKTEDNAYLFDENGRIGGLTIIEDNNMPDNQLVVGDSRFARIYEMGGVVLSEGYSGTQFVEDELTLKARKRMAMLIRTVDQTGFLKCTNITNALATLAT